MPNFSHPGRYHGPDASDSGHDQSLPKPKRRPFLAFPPTFLDDKLGPYATVVYLEYLRHRNNKTGLAWPTLDTIVRNTGISKREVCRGVAALQPKWIEPAGKSGRTPIYRVRSASDYCPVGNNIIA